MDHRSVSIRSGDPHDLNFLYRPRKHQFQVDGHGLYRQLTGIKFVKPFTGSYTPMPPTEAPGSARIRKDICNSTKFLAQNLFCLHTDLHPKIRRRPGYHPQHVLVLFHYETIKSLKLEEARRSTSGDDRFVYPPNSKASSTFAMSMKVPIGRRSTISLNGDRPVFTILTRQCNGILFPTAGQLLGLL